MSGPLFEPPPRIGQRVDEEGHVVLTPDEWADLLSYLDRLVKFIAAQYD